MDKRPKSPPPYAVASVDNALRVAAMLQMEGPMTVTEVAQRLGVATSTAHRLLAMLVYRDFAAQGPDRSYRVGPVMELAAHSHSAVSVLRTTALPHLGRLVDLLNESANLTIRTGENVRFIASVESSQALRVSSREGMVFPAHRTTGGLLLLAELSSEELESLYAVERYEARLQDRPDMAELRAELARVARNGFAINKERSERGLIAVGVAVHGPDAAPVAGLSVSIPSVRYNKSRLPQLVSTLKAAAAALERDLSQR